MKGMAPRRSLGVGGLSASAQFHSDFPQLYAVAKAMAHRAAGSVVYSFSLLKKINIFPLYKELEATKIKHSLVEYGFLLVDKFMT